MADSEHLSKLHEREIPVFTVLKNDCILKNIYLLDNPPSSSSPPYSTPLDHEAEIVETLWVGRHPDCSIRLEHPSISRFHLKIHSKPSSRSLSITDLNSVHGTWISGKKVDPFVMTELNEGDALQLGGSSRLYRLHWVPYSRAYDMENTSVPQLDLHEVEEGTDDITMLQNDSSLFSANKQIQEIISDYYLEGLELLFSSENMCSSVHESSLSTPLVSDEGALQNKSSPCSMYGQENDISSNHFEEESSTPQAFSPSSVHQTMSQSEEMEASVNGSNVSIWSRRGKANSVLIQPSQSRGKSARTGPKAKAAVYETCGTEPLENLYASFDDEVIFTPNKETYLPRNQSLMKKSGKTLPSELLLTTSLDDEVIFTPDKENYSPSNRSLMEKSGTILPSELFLNTTMSSMNLDSKDDDEVFTPDKENITPNSRLIRSLKYVEEGKHQKLIRSSPLKTAFNCSMYQDNDDDDEVFTPDKENITPNSRLLRSTKYMEEGKHQKSYKSSPLKTAVNCNMYQEEVIPFSSLLKESQNRNILQEHRSSNSVSKTHASLKKKTVVKASRADKGPFQALSINIICNEASSQPSACQMPSKSTRSLNCLESEEVIPEHIRKSKPEIMVWNIVADTGCLLNKKSRRELQLLRGLKGTSLYIPRIVVRELDCMLKRGSLFRRTTDVSEALEWIEDCMAKTQWWIHVQSSAELGMLIPPTPPAASSHWRSEDNAPFSPFSLQEIVTPTAEDHILECALSIKNRSRNDERLVLLSDDVAMKIKAMAEGVLCETAGDFRRSLVNPFSERFLYNGSSPTGPTWSSVDDTVLKEIYYPSPTKKLTKPGGVKGLKLILQHNSNFKQITY